MRSHTITVLSAGFALALVQATHAEIAVSSNDGHTIITPSGPASSPDPKPDTLSVINLTGELPRITATVEVPGSVVGPPTAVALTRDERFVLVTSATRADPTGPALAFDDRVSVIDLAGTLRKSCSKYGRAKAPPRSA